MFGMNGLGEKIWIGIWKSLWSKLMKRSSNSELQISFCEENFEVEEMERRYGSSEFEICLKEVGYGSEAYF